MLGVVGAGPAPTGRLRGEITSGAKGIGYANVVLVEARIGTLTDGSGRFSLTGLPIGSRRFTINALGYAKHDTTLNVVAGDNPPLRVNLVDLRDKLPCSTSFWVGPRYLRDARPDGSTAGDGRSSVRGRAGSLSIASDPDPCRLQIDCMARRSGRRGSLIIADPFGRRVHAFEVAGPNGLHTTWTGENEAGRLLAVGSYRAILRSGRDSLVLDFVRTHDLPPR